MTTFLYILGGWFIAPFTGIALGLLIHWFNRKEM
jgi:ABC-type nitrate/sulfonate/bicarbonate transport system permease component